MRPWPSPSMLAESGPVEGDGRQTHNVDHEPPAGPAVLPFRCSSGRYGRAFKGHAFAPDRLFRSRKYDSHPRMINTAPCRKTWSAMAEADVEFGVLGPLEMRVHGACVPL